MEYNFGHGIMITDGNTAPKEFVATWPIKRRDANFDMPLDIAARNEDHEVVNIMLAVWRAKVARTTLNKE